MVKNKQGNIRMKTRVKKIPKYATLRISYSKWHNLYETKKKFYEVVSEDGTVIFSWYKPKPREPIALAVCVKKYTGIRHPFSLITLFRVGSVYEVYDDLDAGYFIRVTPHGITDNHADHQFVKNELFNEMFKIVSYDTRTRRPNQTRAKKSI